MRLARVNHKIREVCTLCLQKLGSYTPIFVSSEAISKQIVNIYHSKHQRLRHNFMDNANSLDRKNLQTQLDNYKLIIELNTNSEEESLFAKDGLAKKIELAQSYLNDADDWGKLGDYTKSHDALSNANMIIVEITSVLKHILNQGIRSDDNNLQSRQISN
jgi:hypothetical protein